MRFFIDNNLPPALARALNELTFTDGHEVVHLRDRFSPSISDREWIDALAEEQNWIIVTQDRLKKGSLEKEALRNSKLTAFFLKSGWASVHYWEKTWKLVRWWPAIITQAERVEPGATFLVPLKFSGKGRFEQFNY
jgi:hypothetical protein